MTTTPIRTVRISRALLGAVLLAGLPVGAGAGYLVGPVTRWSVDALGGVPGPLRLLELIPEPWLVGGGALVGLVAAALLAATILSGTTSVEIGAEGVTVERDGARCYVGRDRIATVFTDPRDLVFRDADGRELLRRPSDVGARRLGAAFEAAGYPWSGTRDPDENRFQSWVDGTPDLAGEVHALLRRRARALRGDDADTASDLREQAQDAGVVIRDRGADHGQQWRPLARATEPARPSR